jgi:hypothetical protein
MQIRRGCIDCQGVDVGFEQVVEGGVHHAVARHRGQAAKRFRYDSDPKMTVALRGAGVTFVQVTFILNDQHAGRKLSL